MPWGSAFGELILKYLNCYFTSEASGSFAVPMAECLNIVCGEDSVYCYCNETIMNGQCDPTHSDKPSDESIPINTSTTQPRQHEYVQPLNFACFLGLPWGE
jgi:hypothetical protein